MYNRIMIKMLSLFIFIWVFSAMPVIAQDPPPPPSNHGGSGNVPGGGAPIDGGLTFLLVMGAAYGARKVYKLKT
jgi:hypothetical protein